mgnify:CR=1 FL=1
MPIRNECEPVHTYTTGTGCVGTAMVGVNCPPQAPDKEINRKRALELAKLAFDCIEYLEKEGLASHEWCIFGDIIRNLHNYPHSKPLVVKGRKRATSK